MQAALTDLFCDGCQSYVHAFLDRCIACGAARRSDYAEARRDPASVALDLGDGAIGQAADEARRSQLVMSMRHGMVFAVAGDRDSGSDDEPDIADLFNRIARSLTYRAYGVPPHPESPIEAALAVAPDGLRITDVRRRAVAITLPTERILCITAPGSPSARGATWAGVWFGDTHLLPAPLVPPGGLVITYAADEGPAQVSVGNRPGFLATKARSGHYEEMGRWLGVLAGAAAGAHCRAVGADVHAADLGLLPRDHAGRAVPGAADASAAAGAGTEPVVRAPERPTVRESLQELEGLRASGLVTGDEYERARQEILRRL